MATLKGHAHLHLYFPSGPTDRDPVLLVLGFKSSDSSLVYVEDREIEFELPKTDYIPERVEALQAQKTKILNEANEEIMKIEDSIQKLLSLENSNG